MTLKAPKDMSFLIVDDIDNMRRSIRAMLKLVHYGKEFFEAANGRDAWKLLQEENLVIDFVICDYNMPYMSGTELLSLIRSSKRWREIPFLMITADANMDIVAEAAEQDVDAYMTKPFVTATLEQKINELLEQINNPSLFTRYLLASRAQEEKGDLDSAIASAREASKLNERSSRPYRELGRLFAKKNDLPKAQLCFDRAIDLNRLDVSSYHALGQIHYKLGNMEKALEHFNRAMEISPRHSDRALNFARLLLKKGQLPEAEKVLRLVLKIKSSDLDFKEDIADTCCDYGLFGLASKVYRELLKADAERQHLHKKLGLSLLRAEEFNDAVKSLEKAAEKQAEDPEILLAVAKAYLSMKMMIRADQWASKLLRIDPGHQEAREIVNRCL